MTWYTIPKTSSSHEDYDYCKFCLINFNKYNDVINNICQTCGRVNIQITQNKQPSQQITALNATTTETEQLTVRGISTQINYDRLISQDETKIGIHSGNTRASFKSFKEAKDYLTQTSDVSNATLNTRSKEVNDKFTVTTSKRKPLSNSLIIDDNITSIENNIYRKEDDNYTT
jgi:hypothetical protein